MVSHEDSFWRRGKEVKVNAFLFLKFCRSGQCPYGRSWSREISWDGLIHSEATLLSPITYHIHLGGEALWELSVLSKNPTNCPRVEFEPRPLKPPAPPHCTLRFFLRHFKVPATVMNVISERGVKMENQTSRRKINLVYFLFWTSLYQLICVGSLFWLDILPWYGHVDSISEFGRKYVFFFFF